MKKWRCLPPGRWIVVDLSFHNFLFAVGWSFVLPDYRSLIAVWLTATPSTHGISSNSTVVGSLIDAPMASIPSNWRRDCWLKVCKQLRDSVIPRLLPPFENCLIRKWILSLRMGYSRWVWGCEKVCHCKIPTTPRSKTSSWWRLLLWFLRVISLDI
jgi:hypothetical protein